MTLTDLIFKALDKYGPVVAAAIWGMFTKPGGPTGDDWANLISLTATTARQQMMQVLAAHGIDPTSPAGVAFLALTPA